MTLKLTRLGKVLFHYVDTKIRMRNTIRIKYFISKIFQKEKTEFERIDYIFCTDKYLLRINNKFLHHNYYTDTISFPLRQAPVIGEIYISVDRVKSNSKKYKVLFKEELLRVIFHGALHLCGYIDKTKPQIELMKSTESKYLSLYMASK